MTEDVEDEEYLILKRHKRTESLKDPLSNGKLNLRDYVHQRIKFKSPKSRLTPSPLKVRKMYSVTFDDNTVKFNINFVTYIVIRPHITTGKDLKDEPKQPYIKMYTLLWFKRLNISELSYKIQSLFITKE